MGWGNQVSRLGSLLGSIDYWIWMIADRTSEQSTWWLVLLNLDDLSPKTQLAILSSIGLGRVSNNTARMKLWFPGEFGAVFPTLPWSQHHVVFFFIQYGNTIELTPLLCDGLSFLDLIVDVNSISCMILYRPSLMFLVRCSLPEIGIAPDNQWLEDESLFWMTYF